MNSSPRPRLRFLGAGTAFFLLAGGAGALADGSNWHMIAMPHFTVVSEQGAGATADWVAEFDDFLASLPHIIRVDDRRLLPLTIVVLSGETEAQSYFQAPPGQDYWHAASFQFVSQELGRDVMVVGSNNRSEGTRFLAQEGLAEWYLSALPYWRPYAVDIGTAELLSSHRHLANHWKFGQDFGKFRSLLQHENLMPVARLLAVRSTNEFSSDSDRVLFLGESWALAHYLMFGRDPAQRHAFAQLWLGFKEGLSCHDALALALGPAAADRIDLDLRDYIAQGRFYEVEFPVDDSLPSAQPAVPARPEVVEAALALTSLAYRPEWSQAHADAAIRAAPNAPAGYEMRAYNLYFHGGSVAELRSACEEAMARGSTDVGTGFLEAYARFKETGFDISPDEARAIANQAESAINRSPGLQPAFDLLAQALFFAGRVTPSDRLFLDFGHRRFADDWWVTLGEAELALRRGDRAGAADLARTAVAQAAGAPAQDVAAVRSYAQLVDR